MVKADLQEASSLNARVHLPSTNDFDLSLRFAVFLADSVNGKVDGRIRRCNHLECLSSILGCHKNEEENISKLNTFEDPRKIILLMVDSCDSC